MAVHQGLTTANTVVVAATGAVAVTMTTVNVWVMMGYICGSRHRELALSWESGRWL